MKSRKLTYQNILSQMIYQSIDNIHSFLDEEDADEFIEMIRSKESNQRRIEEYTTMRMTSSLQNVMNKKQITPHFRVSLLYK